MVYENHTDEPHVKNIEISLSNKFSSIEGGTVRINSSKKEENRMIKYAAAM
jgi:hypothetical protein